MEKTAGTLAASEHFLDTLLYLLPGGVILGALWTSQRVRDAFGTLWPGSTSGAPTPSLGSAEGILLLLAALGACYILGQANRIIGSAWLVGRGLLRVLEACATPLHKYLSPSSPKLYWAVCKRVQWLAHRLLTEAHYELANEQWAAAFLEEGQSNPFVRAAEACFQIRLPDEEERCGEWTPALGAAVLELCEDVVRAKLPDLYQSDIHRLGILDIFSTGMSTAILCWIPFAAREFGLWWLAIPVVSIAFLWWSQMLKGGRENAIWRTFYVWHCLQRTADTSAASPVVPRPGGDRIPAS